MSTYASAADVVNYIESYTIEDAFAVERLLQRSERDLDRLIRPLHNRGLAPTTVVSIDSALTAGTFTPSWGGQAGTTVPYNDNGTAFTASLQAAILAYVANVDTDLVLPTDTFEYGPSPFPNDGAPYVVVTGTNPWTIAWDPAFVEDNFPGFVMPAITLNTSALTPTSTGSALLVEGLKVYPPMDLTANQAIALSHATCAQFEYRNEMGPDFFVRAQYPTIKGPDFATTGKLPFIAPKAVRELTNSNLLYTQGRAMAGSARRGVGRGWPNY